MSESEKLMQQAAKYRQSKDLDMACKLAEKAVSLDPNNEYAYFGLGYCSMDNGKLEQGINAFKNAIRLVPNRAMTYYGLGECYRMQGDKESAIKAYDKAISLDPNHARSHYWLAACLDQIAPQQAINAFKKALSLDPSLAAEFQDGEKFLLKLGIEHYQQKNLEAAIKAFETVTRLDPKDALACSWLAKCYAEQGRLEQAREMFQRLLSLDPSLVDKIPGSEKYLPPEGRMSMSKEKANQSRKEAEEATRKLVELAEEMRSGDPLAKQALKTTKELEEQGLFTKAVEEFLDINDADKPMLKVLQEWLTNCVTNSRGKQAPLRTEAQTATVAAIALVALQFANAIGEDVLSAVYQDGEFDPDKLRNVSSEQWHMAPAAMIHIKMALTLGFDEMSAPAIPEFLQGVKLALERVAHFHEREWPSTDAVRAAADKALVILKQLRESM